MRTGVRFAALLAIVVFAAARARPAEAPLAPDSLVAQRPEGDDGMNQEAAQDPASAVPDWVAFPGPTWETIPPAQAGLDPDRWQAYVADLKRVSTGFSAAGQNPQGRYGAVITRGGYLLAEIGDGDLMLNSASVGKAFNKIALQLAVDKGYIRSADDLIQDYWTGRGRMSHAFKEMDQGHHAKITFRHLATMRGGFPISNGHNWRNGSHPAWAQSTNDPMRDNYAHRPPGERHYSSGGMWRLNQALTAVIGMELKDFLDRELFGPMSIDPQDWHWYTGRHLHDTEDFYPRWPGYGLFCDPPYEIDGDRVQGGGGWVVMSPKDLARVGLLVACRGVWRGERLVSDTPLLDGHAGFAGAPCLMDGDPDTYVSVGKVDWQASEGDWRINPGEVRAFIVGPVQPDAGE